MLAPRSGCSSDYARSVLLTYSSRLLGALAGQCRRQIELLLQELAAVGHSARAANRDRDCAWLVAIQSLSEQHSGEPECMVEQRLVWLQVLIIP